MRKYGICFLYERSHTRFFSFSFSLRSWNAITRVLCFSNQAESLPAIYLNEVPILKSNQITMHITSFKCSSHFVLSNASKYCIYLSYFVVSLQFFFQRKTNIQCTYSNNPSSYFKVHKEIFGQTQFMRNILMAAKSIHCQCGRIQISVSSNFREDHIICKKFILF